VRRSPSRIPVLALVVGLGTMTAVVALVVFFVMGGDVSTGHSTSVPVAPASAALAPEASSVAPASSFIVITAPDLPQESKPRPPTWPLTPTPRASANKSVPPKASAEASSASSASTTGVDAGATTPPAPPPAPSGAFDDPGF
jgi:hypothetical protein